VPPSAEGNLGHYIYDFFFEPKLEDQQRQSNLKSATKVGDSDGQSSAKKMRTEYHQQGYAGGFQSG
jgi:hypothetical protein